MTREEAIRILASSCIPGSKQTEALETLIPELAESDDERIMSRIIDGFKNFSRSASKWNNIPVEEVIAYLEKQAEEKFDLIDRNFRRGREVGYREGVADTIAKQKENPKSADSIPSNCISDAKCEDRWHKVTDSLPDNGRLVLAKDCLGNVLLARYDGENWEVNVYDNEDHYCHNSISKWCEIPSEKQTEQKPVESISQLTVQGKGVYKICPRCKERMVRDDSMVYTSMPPQYRYECPKCGESECDTVMYDNPEMEEQKPNSTEDMPYITDEHFYEREPADSFKYKLAEYMTRCCTKKEGPYGYEYGISAESILKMAEEELLKRGVVQKPAEWSEEDDA